MITLAELKARLMTDPAFRAAYVEADAEYRPIEAAIRLRRDVSAQADVRCASAHHRDGGTEVR